MEHESEPNLNSPSDPKPESPDTGPSVDYLDNEPPGCGKIILWLVIGGIVIFLAAVAFVFGACLLS